MLQFAKHDTYDGGAILTIIFKLRLIDVYSFIDEVVLIGAETSDNFYLNILMLSVE